MKSARWQIKFKFESRGDRQRNWWQGSRGNKEGYAPMRQSINQRAVQWPKQRQSLPVGEDRVWVYWDASAHIEGHTRAHTHTSLYTVWVWVHYMNPFYHYVHAQNEHDYSVIARVILIYTRILIRISVYESQHMRIMLQRFIVAL